MSATEAARSPSLRSGPHWFVVPDLDGPVTGGTLYNRELIAALTRAGLPARALGLEGARRVLATASAGFFWVDSLHLDAVGELCALSRGSCGVGVILHYLPSLIDSCGDVGRARPTTAEALAMSRASAFLAPSSSMRDAVLRLAGDDRPVLVVEPGRFAEALAAPLDACGGLDAVMVANLLPEKGVARFLAALGQELLETDPLTLTIIGSTELDARYARSCREQVLKHPRLRDRVVFEGALPPRAVVLRLARKNLFVSASVMEAYGMALAEARSLGLPIVARAGGHVAALVDAASGGELARSDAELATACVRLARNPAAHAERLSRARLQALGARSWSDAARDFIAQLAT